jgi:8-oxo-dGTP pyrophosphatase MutT (NUDIX family)
MMKKQTSQAKLEYSNPFMDIRHTRADFGAFHKDYFVVHLGPRAGVVAVRDDLVLLTRQYRFLLDGLSWELPGGRVDPGENPQVAAARECLEETGVECANLQKLVEYYPGLDNFDNRTTLFSTREAKEVRPFQGVESEVIEIRWVPLSDALNMVLSGGILDALTVTGLLAFNAAAR